MLGAPCSPCCFSCVYEQPGTVDIFYRGSLYTVTATGPASGATDINGVFYPNAFRRYQFSTSTNSITIIVEIANYPYSSAPFFQNSGVYVYVKGGLGNTFEEFLEFCNSSTNTLTHWLNIEMQNVGEGLPGICSDAPAFNTIPVRQITDATGISAEWYWPTPYTSGRVRQFLQLSPGVNMFPVRVRRAFSWRTFRPTGRSCLFNDFASEDMTFTGFSGLFKAPVVLP